MMPRPGVFFPLETALLETDRQLAANGIATAYHALTIGWAPGLRSVEKGAEFLAALQALAPRPGFVKSRDQLMDVAYDDQVYVDDRTIDSHIKRLRKKMRGADEEFSAIETLYGIGYRYNEE